MPSAASRGRERRVCEGGGSVAGLRKFGLSRIAVRELASLGKLPGVTKSSW